MDFQPQPTPSGSYAAGLALACGLVALGLLNLLPYQEGLAQIFGLIIGAMLAVLLMIGLLGWAILAVKLRYHLNRNGVIVQWGFARQLIPFASIKQIITEPGDSAPVSFKGWHFFGVRFGQGELPEHGPTRFYTTAPIADSLLIVTPDQTYCLSPQEPTGFIHAWQVRQPLGPTQEWQPGIERHWPFNLPILTDKLTWGLTIAGVVSCLALFGYLAVTFADLPRTVPLQINALGEIGRTADKAFLFLFPIVGAVLWLINTVVGSLAYQEERLAAYFSWGSAVVVQICLWVAVYTIVSGVV